MDAPGSLHPVMVRGIARAVIFRDDPDRGDFLARLAPLAERDAVTGYAWALVPNHAPLLLRTGNRTLAPSLRSLLTGSAGAFNRRHKRAGHLQKVTRVAAGPLLFPPRLIRGVRPYDTGSGKRNMGCKDDIEAIL